MAMERLSDVIRKQSWHPGMQRKYRRRMWITVAVQIVLTSIVFYHVATVLPPRDENPPQNVYELLEAIRPQIVEPTAQK